jgi:ABC-type cobalamin transport system permease subunit
MTLIRPYLIFAGAIIVWIVTIGLLTAAVVGAAFFFRKSLQTKDLRYLLIGAACTVLAGSFGGFLGWMISALKLH